MNTQRWVCLLAASSLLTALAAIVVPRFVTPGEGGLAAAAMATLTFLALIAVAMAEALVAFTLTLGAYRTLTWPARTAGIVPAIVLGAVLAWVMLFVRY